MGELVSLQGGHMRIWDPDTTLFITNRCEEERFFLLPKRTTRKIIKSWLAKALSKYPGIELYAYIFMGNHLHLLLRDPLGQLADFMGYLQLHMGKAINRDVLGHRRGHFWSRSYSAIPLLTDEDFVERYTYILANPLKPGLVAKVADSPFVSSYQQALSEEPLPCTWLDRTKRNNMSRGGRRVDEETCTENLSIKLTVPPMWQSMSQTDRRTRIEKLLKGQEKRYGRLRAAENRSVLGARRILAQNPYMRPKNPARSPAPRVFCKNPELAREYLAKIRTLVGLYREAFDGFTKAAHKKRTTLIEWPPGTYPPSMTRPIGAAI